MSSEKEFKRVSMDMLPTGFQRKKVQRPEKEKRIRIINMGWKKQVNIVARY